MDRPPAHADERRVLKIASTRSATVRFPLLSILCLLIARPADLYADGGTIRAFAARRRLSGHGLHCSDAAPRRAGDVSVFVQDAATGEPAVGVAITVQAAASGKPDQAVSYAATAAAATNKLFRSADFELPGSGRWQFLVTLQGEGGQGIVRFEADAADPPPSWLAMAPWVGWPALAVLLFAVHQMLVRKKTHANRI